MQDDTLRTTCMHSPFCPSPTMTALMRRFRRFLDRFVHRNPKKTSGEPVDDYDEAVCVERQFFDEFVFCIIFLWVMRSYRFLRPHAHRYVLQQKKKQPTTSSKDHGGGGGADDGDDGSIGDDEFDQYLGRCRGSSLYAKNFVSHTQVP